jgi:hypothetical protein
MVKRWKAVWMLTVAVAMVGCATVQGADPNGLHFSFWPTAGDEDRFTLVTGPRFLLK